MDFEQTQIFDLLFRTGPQTVEQIALGIGVDAATVSAAVQHEWFEIRDTQVQIARTKPPTSVA